MSDYLELHIHGGITLVSRSSHDVLTGLTLYVGKNGYAYYCRWLNGKSRPSTVHSLLVKAPRGMHVDHINGDKLDNRLENLRVVTPQSNQVNRKRLNKNNTSGIRGVARRGSLKNPWHAQIMVNGKNIYLGLFPTMEAAAQARRLAELKYYGELCP